VSEFMKTNEIKMNTCPKCGSAAVPEEPHKYPSTRIHFACDGYGYTDGGEFDLVYRSELCLEREEKNTLQRKVEEFAEDLCVERIAHANTIRKLDDKHKQVCELKRERNRLIDDLQASTIHSCGDSCSRPMCVLRRERDAYKEALEMIAYDGSFPKLDCQKLADATLTEIELSKEGEAK